MKLSEVKTLALQYVVQGDVSRALRIFQAVLAEHPSDLEARTKVADLCLHAGHPELARRVYAAVAFYDLRAGRPLHALVVARALESLGADVASIYDSLGALYSRGASTLSTGRGGARLAPPDPDSTLELPSLRRELALAKAVDAAVEAASSTTDLADLLGLLGERFAPAPLLSELDAEVLSRVARSAIVHRLPHGTRVIEEGTQGTSLFLVASGQVRVLKAQRGGPPVELSRLGEGAIFGEQALLHATPRQATVEVVREADLLELGPASLAAAGDQLQQVADALGRLTRERLIRTLLVTHPLFRVFSEEERLELVRRFRGVDAAPGTLLLEEGRPSSGLFIVLSGTLDSWSGEGAFATPREPLGPGAMFGDTALVAAGPATHSVRCAGPCQLLCLDPEPFMRLLRSVPEVAALFQARLGSSDASEGAHAAARARAPRSEEETADSLFDLSDEPLV
jgi:CRP-like cAMP-binding protein